jgi:hypothetical protein
LHKITRSLTLMLTTAFLTLALGFGVVPSHAVRAEEPAKTTHSFIAFGNHTRIIDEDGKVVWKYARGARDGYVLPDGKIVLAVNRGGPYPGGAVVEITREGDKQMEHLIWKGTQSEVNSVQPVGTGDAMRYVLTEAGPNPRLLEVDRDGKVYVEFKLACQNKNAHMETRMARKLDDGTYLAPHLLDFAVKQYDKTGKVLKTFDTTAEGDPGRKIHTWPFTAIRLPDGSTHVNLTHGNRSARFDADGKIIWQVSNKDLPGPWLADPCGAQVLPNGNVVIASYGQRNAKLPKLIEVTPDKKVVWTHYDNIGNSAHHFQILTTNGKPLEGVPMK